MTRCALVLVSIAVLWSPSSAGLPQTVNAPADPGPLDHLRRGFGGQGGGRYISLEAAATAAAALPRLRSLLVSHRGALVLEQDPQGVFFGGNEMLMTPRQMVRFGELYLNDGRAGDRQLLPKSWIANTRVPRGRSRWGSDREYGYGFWIRELAGHQAYYAWGYGGQFVFIVPDLQLVVVTTSRSDVSRERRDHLEAIYGLVEQSVIPAIAAAGPPPAGPLRREVLRNRGGSLVRLSSS